MKNILLDELRDKYNTYIMHKEHQNAKYALNIALSGDIDYTIDIPSYCNKLCDTLYQFDKKQIQKSVKKYGSCPYKSIQKVLKPIFMTGISHVNNTPQRRYVSLIYVTYVIASFMDRYDLGTRDWSSQSTRNVKHFLSFQPAYNPRVNLADYFTKPQRIYTVMQAGHDVRKIFPSQSV